MPSSKNAQQQNERSATDALFQKARNLLGGNGALFYRYTGGQETAPHDFATAGSEQQVYGWNQTKKNSLGAQAALPEGTVPVISSAVSINTMPETDGIVNTDAENLQIAPSTNESETSDNDIADPLRGPKASEATAFPARMPVIAACAVWE